MNAPDIRSEVRRIIWTLLIFGAVMSLAGNVVHAFMQHGWSVRLIGPVVAAAIPPVALLGLMHLMGAWSRWTESDGVSYWVFLIGVLALGGAAFRLSFATLRDLAERYGYSRFDASLFPLILDGLMALMTWGLVAATRPKVAHHLTTETAAVAVQEPVAHPDEPVHVPVQEQVVQEAPLPEPRTADHPAEPVDRVADQSVDQPEPQLVHENADQQVNQPLTWDDADTEPLAVQATDRSAAEPDQHPEAEVDRDPLPVPEPVNHRTLSLVDQAADRDVDHRALAEQVVARTASDWTADQVELVSRHTPGRGQRVLAEELDVSPSTVNRMRKALAEVAAESDDPDRASVTA